MKKLRLYTIQHRAAVDHLLSTGSLFVKDPSLVDQDFIGSYRWMMGQMAQRIPDFSGNFPIWAWMRRGWWHTNLRNWSLDEWVLLTIEVPANRFVISDFGAWHYVLNNCFLPLSEDADIENPTQEQKRESWVNIFRQGPGEIGWDNVWQVCLDGLYAHEVVQVGGAATALLKPVKIIDDLRSASYVCKDHHKKSIEASIKIVKSYVKMRRVLGKMCSEIQFGSNDWIEKLTNLAVDARKLLK